MTYVRYHTKNIGFGPGVDRKRHGKNRGGPERGPGTRSKVHTVKTEVKPTCGLETLKKFKLVVIEGSSSICISLYKH